MLETEQSTGKTSSLASRNISVPYKPLHLGESAHRHTLSFFKKTVTSKYIDKTVKKTLKNYLSQAFTFNKYQHKGSLQPLFLGAAEYVKEI